MSAVQYTKSQYRPNKGAMQLAGFFLLLFLLVEITQAWSFVSNGASSADIATVLYESFVQGYSEFEVGRILFLLAFTFSLLAHPIRTFVLTFVKPNTLWVGLVAFILLYVASLPFQFQYLLRQKSDVASPDAIAEASQSQCVLHQVKGRLKADRARGVLKTELESYIGFCEHQARVALTTTYRLRKALPPTPAPDPTDRELRLRQAADLQLAALEQIHSRLVEKMNCLEPKRVAPVGWLCEALAIGTTLWGRTEIVATFKQALGSGAHG